ncbi:hypothetical protein [Streptomyces sp. NRRL F-2664]|uniref:hypothetical protein n=1 Tax=Streptomyces sp. NRRL F-2664 TaxID=1463842 RepID=UPI00131C5178|nr:hypothetical protein [Streptomyces sp. NRRL F-2664]
MKKKRTFSTLAAVFAAAALPIVAASPASASSADCQVYLRNVGYNVGAQVQAACDHAAAWDMSGMNRHACYASLVNLGVKANDASTACYQLA